MAQGLAALKRQKQENREREEARNRPKANWFKFPDGVTQVKMRFLQEIDEESPNHNPDNGLAVMAIEHEKPGKNGFMKRMSCTMNDEGRCLPCSRHEVDYKAGWRQKQNFYINALVEIPGETPKVFMVTRNFNSAFVDQLLEETEDEGTITEKNFRVTKTGEGTKTAWLIKPLNEEPFDTAGAEVFDIKETALRDIEFDKQDTWFGDFEESPRGDHEESTAEVQNW